MVFLCSTYKEMNQTIGFQAALVCTAPIGNAGLTSLDCLPGATGTIARLPLRDQTSPLAMKIENYGKPRSRYLP
jgi:hypothetical protein